MTGHTEFTADTLIAYVKRNPIFLKDVYTYIRVRILQNQKTATDLEKKIDDFMAFVTLFEDGTLENKDPTVILDFAKACFGYIEVEE